MQSARTMKAAPAAASVPLLGSRLQQRAWRTLPCAAMRPSPFGGRWDARDYIRGGQKNHESQQRGDAQVCGEKNRRSGLIGSAAAVFLALGRVATVLTD
jgi:hypothetical protein